MSYTATRTREVTHPISVHSSPEIRELLNHLIGTGEQGWWDDEADGTGVEMREFAGAQTQMNLASP